MKRKPRPRLVPGQVVNGFTLIRPERLRRDGGRRRGHDHVWRARHTCGRIRLTKAQILRDNEIACACKYELPPISPVDAAWLAAAIDGEGTICMSLSMRSAKTVGFALKLKPNIAVSNTVRAYVERAMKAAGCGSIGRAKPVKGFRSVGYSRESAYFSWDLSTWAHAEQVLRACLPHFVIKGHKARAMLACCVRRRALHRNGSTRMTSQAARRLARFVHSRYLVKFQADGKAIKTCRKFLAFINGGRRR